MKITALQKLDGAKKVTSLSDITENCRLFYELGHYKVLRLYTNRDGLLCEELKWVREGVFKEIENIKEFIEMDKKLSEKEYIEHHNFVIIES
jgi:hypothetical protein